MQLPAECGSEANKYGEQEKKGRTFACSPYCFAPCENPAS